MFVCSVKSPKSKIIAIVLVLLLILLGFVVCSQLEIGSHGDKNDGVTTTACDLVQTDHAISYDAADSSERLQFIRQFGWEVKEEPEEIIEVRIPDEFDDVYLKYNALQQSQGLDLESYRGERVKRWSYAITNYPGSDQADQIRVNLLVCKGVVIGGDVCSLAEDGFMHGFDKSTAETGNLNES